MEDYKGMTNKRYRGVEIEYDEIDVDDLIKGIGLEDIFELKDLEERKLYLTGEVTVYNTTDLVHKILQYNADDKGVAVEDRKPIRLYITSEGGDVQAGFGLIDVIVASKTPVYTINLGYWYSMGLMIGLSGHKRYASQDSSVLLHDGSNFAYNSANKVQDQMDFFKKLEARMKSLVVAKTNVTAKMYDKKARVEWYMLADEAKELGFVDYLIGTDCDLDEVL